MEVTQYFVGMFLLPFFLMMMRMTLIIFVMMPLPLPGWLMTILMKMTGWNSIKNMREVPADCRLFTSDSNSCRGRSVSQSVCESVCQSVSQSVSQLVSKTVRLLSHCSELWREVWRYQHCKKMSVNYEVCFISHCCHPVTVWLPSILLRKAGIIWPSCWFLTDSKNNESCVSPTSW